MLEQFQPWMDYEKLIEIQAEQARLAEKSQEEKRIMTKNKPYLQSKRSASRVDNLKAGRK